MDTSLFRRFCDLAYEKAGIYLPSGKEAPVEARVAKRQRVLSIHDAREYLELLESGQSHEELLSFLDAISTNYASFFRESSHFDFLAKVVNGWIHRGQERFRFWSAACSSGQEPYSMAMTLLEDCRAGCVDFKILATDLSSEVLARARTGRYSEDDVRPVPDRMRRKYFEPVLEGPRDERLLSASASVRERIVFKRFNLAATPFPMRGPLDVVFCRNVLIYFDNPVRERLVRECERLLKRGGFLLIGHSETLTGIESHLESVAPSIFRKRDGS